jgi:acyl carrier protein
VITVDEVGGLIRRELRGKLGADVMLDESTRLEDLGLSSLQVSEIVFTLEENHQVEFDAARAADAKTLGDVVVFANEALGVGGDSPDMQSPDMQSAKA